MKLLLVGATGGTGARLLDQALAAGHEVTGVARHPEKVLPKGHHMLTLVQGDVLDDGPWRAAAAGQEIALSCLGSTDRRKPTTIYSRGTMNVLEAMGTSPTRRLICLSSGGLDISPDTSFAQRIVTKLVIQRMYRYAYQDMTRMEKLIHRQDVHWTVVRAPMLTDNPATGEYRTAVGTHLHGAKSISRADLAHSMLNAIGDSTTWKATVEISS
jgi:putative NADH-flavin reductase